jgi:uncharacterized repeat protein (TIGR03806 family)
MKIFYRLFCLGLISVFFACSSDNDGMPGGDDGDEVSPVVFDLNEMPYPKLSDYNFFKTPLNDLKPVYGVIPYEPISTLFSDYAKKKRFIWMPEGVSANYVSDGDALNFPEGTILIKNFYYDHILPHNSTQILETRLMIKKQGQWIFASYVWNEDQTEAVYDMDGSYVPLTWNENGEIKEVNYRIPNGVECVTCHNKAEIPLPIGPKPQNLNKDFPYETGMQNQLEKLKDFGYLASYPDQIQTVVDYHDTSQPLELRVRSYLDINCSHCHSDDGFCNYRAPRFSFSRTNNPENLGICVVPDEDISNHIDAHPTHIVNPGHHEKSVIYYRLNTTQENIRMPLRGRTVIHEEGVEMITEWIDSLEPNCE